MADDAALVRGIAIILRECFELSQTEDAALDGYAERLLASIKAGESELALRMQVGDAQRQLDGIVNNSTCKEVIERACKLMAENSN